MRLFFVLVYLLALGYSFQLISETKTNYETLLQELERQLTNYESALHNERESLLKVSKELEIVKQKLTESQTQSKELELELENLSNLLKDLEKKLAYQNMMEIIKIISAGVLGVSIGVSVGIIL